MKPFDERFADRVRDEFDAYREAVDPAALDQIRRRLRSGRAFVPLFAWQIVAAASILLISAATLWWARPWMQTDPAVMSGSDIAESIAPQQIVDPGLQQRQTVEPNEQQRLTIDSDEQLKLTVPPDQSERIQTVPGVSEQPYENDLILQRITVAEAGDSDRMANQPGHSRQTEGDIRLPKIVFRDLTSPSLPVAVSDPLIPETPRSGGMGTSFGITAGSMVSYTSSQFAGGMGFFAGALQEWQLTESLSLSSGGTLVWNRFDFEPAGGTTADQALAQRFTTLSAARSDVDLDFDTRREFSWIALDIPLNMTLDVGGNSRGRYNLTLGLSSLIYLQQRFLDEGTNYTGVVARDAVTGMYEVDIQGIRYSEQENKKAFSRFDLARLMNIAVGYSVRNKRNPLTFELYLKYPLGNLTTREISFGMGGISMRYAIGR